MSNINKKNQNQPLNNHQSIEYINIFDMVHTILRAKWMLLLFILLTILIAFIIAYGQLPIYKADTLLRVEPQKSGVPGLDNLTELMGSEDASVGTELELIKSRRNLSIAVKALKLDIVASPKKVPYLSNLYQRFYSPDTILKPKILSSIDRKLHKYAWGNESIKVDRFDTPLSWQNTPFTVVVKTDKTFNLVTNESNKVLIENGVVGKLSKSENGLFKIFISKITGQNGSEYNVTKLSMRLAILELQERVVAVEKTKKTGIISLSLTGNNQQRIVNTLDKIASTYVAQNKTRSSEEASNALSFLEEQVKPVRERVNNAEAAIRTYRIQNQTTNLPLETQKILEVVAIIEAEYQQFNLTKEELSQRYTDQHPTILAIKEQQKKLLSRKRSVEAKISRLPKKQQVLLKLEREIKVSDVIYTDMLNKIQEFKIAKASTVGNAYVVDLADINERFIKPDRKRIMTIGTILGTILGIMVIFLRKALRHAIENPDELEKMTGLPVYATIPISKQIKQSSAFNTKVKKQKSLLAKDNPNDPAIESLRSLRTSLHFAMHEAKNNIVMITGPSPSIGKSFVASNFAAVVASSGQRVVLVDADMRKGYVHELFDIPMSPGLSDLITEQAAEEIIQSVDAGTTTKIDVITRGQQSPNPSELLMHAHFKNLLDYLSENYDLVIIDSPPIHAVTDPNIIGSHVGVVFMVVLSGQHSLAEIEHAVERLQHNGVETKGFIFNGSKAGNGYGYGYGYGYGAYYGD